MQIKIFEISIWLCISAAILTGCGHEGTDVIVDDNEIRIQEDGILFSVQRAGFRYAFSSDSIVMVPPHKSSGLLAGNPDSLSPAVQTTYLGKQDSSYQFSVTCSNEDIIEVSLTLDSGQARFQLKSRGKNDIGIVLRNGGVAPGFGLGDHLIDRYFQGTTDKGVGEASTDITGFVNNSFNSSSGPRTRMVSNFAIYPQNNFALINIDPKTKIVRSTRDEIVQGSRSTREIKSFYYFFGNPHQIYRQYLNVRNKIGYPVMKPKYAFYGVGWEAWGALGWKTRQSTVREDVDHYLDAGYPLEWMVIGSGFWPQTADQYKSTTSFGMWGEKYPEPKQMIRYYHQKGIKVFLGLRIAFLKDGPFTDEGIKEGYFIEENGEPKLFDISFPRHPVYLLDTQNPRSVQWYVNLCSAWGVDGFKEDLFGYLNYPLRDDKLNKVNHALMSQDYYIMQRNSYLASTGGLHRIEDFNYDMDQDRGPINTLTLAYSGFPLTYPDIIGGLFGGQEFDGEVSNRIKEYIMRNARFASLHPGMAVGKGPWHFNDEQVSKVVLNAARMHDRLQPYFYSQAVRYYREGFPWTMTPLPLAYPGDPKVYGRENNSIRGYQWMIGDALMATPLYGENYETASERNIYLPEGIWIDYETGQRYEGPRLLKNFSIPVEKIPLFVGGTGIVIEEKEGRLKGRIYPVDDSVETTLYGSDGDTKSSIIIEKPDWKHVNVIDLTTSRQITGKWIRHAYEFDLTPGHDYKIQ